MAGLDRDDRCPDLDACRLGSDEGSSGEGVELVGNLRDPDGRQTGFLGPSTVGPEPLDLGAVAPSLWADHQPDPHAASSVDLMRTIFL